MPRREAGTGGELGTGLDEVIVDRVGRELVGKTVSGLGLKGFGNGGGVSRLSIAVTDFNALKIDLRNAQSRVCPLIGWAQGGETGGIVEYKNEGIDRETGLDVV